MERFVAHTRSDGETEIIRGDSGGGKKIPFRSYAILIEGSVISRLPDTPRFDRCAERGLVMLEVAQLVARARTDSLFGHVQMQNSTDDLCAQVMKWACDSFNRTATNANPNSESPYEIWYGISTKLQVLPFPQPGIYGRKRTKNCDPNDAACFLLGPGPNHPRGTMHILDVQTSAVVNRHIS